MRFYYDYKLPWGLDTAGENEAEALKSFGEKGHADSFAAWSVQLQVIKPFILSPANVSEWGIETVSASWWGENLGGLIWGTGSYFALCIPALRLHSEGNWTGHAVLGNRSYVFQLVIMCRQSNTKLMVILVGRFPEFWFISKGLLGCKHPVMHNLMADLRCFFTVNLGCAGLFLCFN